MAKRATTAKTKASVQAHHHKASRVNIPTEELREFVADAEKAPGRARVLACESASVRD